MGPKTEVSAIDGTESREVKILSPVPQASTLCLASKVSQYIYFAAWSPFEFSFFSLIAMTGALTHFKDTDRAQGAHAPAGGSFPHPGETQFLF